MSPTDIHEHTIQFFSNCVRELLAPYRSHQIQISHLPNSGITGEDGRDLIPDLRLDLEPRYGIYGVPLTVWVGECGYSQSRQDMEWKLLQMTQNEPSINAAFMISIQNPESAQIFPRRHHLLSNPILPPSAFRAPLIRPATALTDINVGNIVWCAIRSVEIFVFIRGEDGRFNFEVGGENPHAAYGMLHPQIQMEQAAQLLNTASRQLLITIAEIMEAHGDSDHANVRHAAQMAMFPIDWSLFLEHIQSSIHQTAFTRYKKWHKKWRRGLPASSTNRSNRRRN